MLDRLFGTPAVSGLESDAFWLGLFLGLFTSVGAITVLAFAVLPAAIAVELLPLFLVVALLLAYPLARGWIRLLSRLVRRSRRLRRGPDWPEE